MQFGLGIAVGLAAADFPAILVEGSRRLRRLFYSAQKAVGRRRRQQAVLDGTVNLEFRMRPDPLPDRGLRVIALSPGTLRPGVIGGHVFHKGIEHNAIATFADKTSIGVTISEVILDSMI